MPRVNPSGFRRARRAAPYAAALGSIAIVLANWTSSYCDVYLASQFFECEPVAAIDDLGHSLLSVAAVPIVLTLTYPFVPAVMVWISRFGVTVMAVLAAIYLLLAAGLLGHTMMVAPLLLAWTLFAIWLSAERGFPLGASIFAFLLGGTVIVWALAFRGGVANDAVRVAGGGLFVAGYPLWLAYASRAPSAVSRTRPRALFAALRLLGVAAITVLAVLPALLIWFAATIGGPILGDPGYPLTVTNATSETVVLDDISASGGRSRIEPGTTQRLLWGFGSLPNRKVVATTTDGIPIYCREVSSHEYLRIKAHITIIRDTSSC